MEQLTVLKHDGGGSGKLAMMSEKQTKAWYLAFVKFATDILKKDLDWGKIPGTPKNTLYKPGAEKLRFAFGIGTTMEVTEKVTDIMAIPVLIDYTYKCTARNKAGQIIAECEGSCNSWEKNFRYVWKDVYPKPTKEEGDRLKATGGYKWKVEDSRGVKTFTFQQRTDNPDMMEKKNTIMKIAQKRAFVGAILMATGASEFFTQDLDSLTTDDDDHGESEPEQFEDGVLDNWKQVISACKTQPDLNDLYNANKTAIMGSDILKGLMKDRETVIKKESGKDKAKKAVDNLDKKLSGK